MSAGTDYQKMKDGSPKKPAAKVDAAADAAFRGYVNVNLDPSLKEDYNAWVQTEALWVVLESAVSDGVHLALRADPKSAGYLASATQRRASSPNAGLVVTARGRSASLAWGRLLFILEHLARKPRWEDTQPVADPDRW